MYWLSPKEDWRLRSMERETSIAIRTSPEGEHDIVTLPNNLTLVPGAHMVDYNQLWGVVL